LYCHGLRAKQTVHYCTAAPPNTLRYTVQQHCSINHTHIHAHAQIKGATGAAVWTWTDGTKGSDIASAITIGQDGTVVLAGYTSGFYGNKGIAATAAAGAAGDAAAPATANAGLYDMVAVGLSGSKGKLQWAWQVGGERSLLYRTFFAERY
jgi:hypothetical protein